MKNIEDQLKARKILTEVMHEMLTSTDMQTRDRLYYKLESGIHFYQQMYGESFMPFYEPKGEK